MIPLERCIEAELHVLALLTHCSFCVCGDPLLEEVVLVLE